MKKKIFLSLLCGLMTLTLVTGCGNNNFDTNFGNEGNFNDMIAINNASSTAQSVFFAAEAYYADTILAAPTVPFEPTIFTFDGNTNPVELSLKGTIPTSGSITIDSEGKVHIGVYNSNTGKYEGSLIILGCECKQIQGYEIKCEKQ